MNLQMIRPPIVAIRHVMPDPPFGPYRISINGPDGVVASFDSPRLAADWLSGHGYSALAVGALWARPSVVLPLWIRAWRATKAAFEYCAGELSHQLRRRT
jgi:hypothetical protein